MTRYIVTHEHGYRWSFYANLAEASAGLYWRTDEPEEPMASTPFQTADARHDPWQAAELLWDYAVRQGWEDEEAAGAIEKVRPARS